MSSPRYMRLPNRSRVKGDPEPPPPGIGDCNTKYALNVYSVHNLSTGRRRPVDRSPEIFHSQAHLSTETVDNWTGLWKVSDDLSTRQGRLVDRLWIEYTSNAYFVLQSPIPGGEGSRSPFTLDLLGDLMYLGEDITVAVYEVGYLCRSVHNGGMVASAEGLPDLGE
jgi:hypothetical protein